MLLFVVPVAGLPRMPTPCGLAVHADTIFIVQRRDGDVMISLFAGADRPDEATQAVAKQVSTTCFAAAA